MRLPTNEVITALGGRVVRRERLPATIAISTDSRTIRPSETFLALSGERFDGGKFVADAVARGASAAIVSDAAAIPAGTAGIIVSDTLRAYLALAALARARVRGPLIAITGSTGKTTTKTFALQLFFGTGRPAVATPANENNEIAVAKFLLSLEDGEMRPGIVEMGARKHHDIAPLVAAAKPNIAVLTNIGDAHLEIVGGRANLIETKWEIFGGGARAVLNLADSVALERHATLPAPPMWFGIDDERPPAGAPGAIVGRTEVLIYDGAVERRILWSADLPGDHNRRNLAAALAAGILAGLDPAAVAAAGVHVELPSGRYERIEKPGNPVLIYDAYNASMSGALATLATFAREPATRRIAVLGSMAELGPESETMHERVGAAAAAAADVVLVGGAFADNDEAVAWLREHAVPSDVVLLKGSRMYHMEQIVEGLGV
jgi:UDP-N-acetylmuramoyl-tripeptide--D-alanyl-D-alanine ligase